MSRRLLLRVVRAALSGLLSAMQNVDKGNEPYILFIPNKPDKKKNPDKKTCSPLETSFSPFPSSSSLDLFLPRCYGSLAPRFLYRVILYKCLHICLLFFLAPQRSIPQLATNTRSRDSDSLRHVVGRV